MSHDTQFAFRTFNYNCIDYLKKPISKDRFKKAINKLNNLSQKNNGNHIYVKNGCPNCGYNVSKSETEWLDSLFIPREFRQKIITINGIRYKVDAYDIKNKIYTNKLKNESV